MNRGAWWAAVHGVRKSPTGLKRLSPHPCPTLWEDAPQVWRRSLGRVGRVSDHAPAPTPYPPPR